MKKMNIIRITKTNLFKYLIFLFMACTACTHTYTGYVINDNGIPMDGVLITFNYDSAGSWLEKGIPSVCSDCIYTDSTGFFSFDGVRKNDAAEIWFVKSDYQLKHCRQESLCGNHIVLYPEWRLREDESNRLFTTKQLPLQYGQTKFIVHKLKAYVHKSNTLRPPSIVYTAIYLDTDKQSEYYNYFTDFRLGEYYHPEPATVRRKIPDALPRRWIGVEEYKGTYYLYASYPRLNPRYLITDTTIIYFGYMDGDYGYAYTDIEQKGAGHYIIKNMSKNGQKYYDELRIRIIDSMQGIAVFELYEDGKITRQSLYVDEQKARKLPIIVHKSEGDVMPHYFPLDTINLDNLLKDGKK